MGRLLRRIAQYPIALFGASSLVLIILDGMGVIAGGPALRALLVPAFVGLYAVEFSVGGAARVLGLGGPWMGAVELVCLFAGLMLLDTMLRRASAGAAIRGRGAV